MAHSTTCRAAATLLAFVTSACTTPGPTVKRAARQVEVTPCVWAAGFDGGVRIRGQFGPRASFSDGLGDLDAAAMLTVLVPFDRWTLFADASHVSRSHTFDLHLHDFVPTYSDVEEQIYGLSLGYRITEGGAVDVDVLAGARGTVVDARLEVGPLFVGGIISPPLPFDGSEAWVDAIAGTRIAYHFADHCTLVGHFDAGGGGAEFTAQGIASIEFDVSRTVSLKLGYRHLYADYDDDDFEWRMNTGGFFAGAGIRF